jgi:hypothetical protein
MIRKLLCVTVVLLVAVVALLAADAVTGKWTYEQPMMGRGGGGGGGAPGGGGGGGNMPPRIVTLDLKADGAKLTGTALMPAFGRRGGGGGGEAPPAQPPIQITNGKVDGNNISFEVSRDTPNGAMVTKYEGAVSGSEMKLKITSPGFGGGDPRVSDVVAKKQ